jgi:glycosyltransferase involved in cell wall biosynthesis
VISNVCSAKDFDSYCNNLAIKKRQFLSVGASWKHKNIHTFITNWKIWSDRYSLVIVCGRTKYFKFLSDLVEEYGLLDSVIFYHDVTFGQLKSLYSESLGLIYPSLDEGFGIPPIEALLCKCVPVVNDIPIFHEVLGDSALYVNPDSKDSWREAIYFFDNFKNVLFDFSAGEKYGTDRLNKELRQFLEVSK